jgi:hypothetical protein
MSGWLNPMPNVSTARPRAAGSSAPACSERLIPFRTDAKPDEDGNCTVCGCLWDGVELDGSVQHVCPEGFRSFVIPNSPTCATRPQAEKP